jgi:hypothetical protein
MQDDGFLHAIRVFEGDLRLKCACPTVPPETNPAPGSTQRLHPCALRQGAFSVKWPAVTPGRILPNTHCVSEGEHGVP